MAQNFVKDGCVIEVTLGATIAAGAGILIGSLVGVALKSGVSGDTINVALVGVWDLPKAPGAVTQGAALYWDNTAKKVTTTSAGNTLMGYAYAAALSGDANARVRLMF